MSQVVLEDVDSQLAQLVQRASSGEDIVIIQNHTPIARITALPENTPKEREGGFGSGKYALVYMADDFDAPLDDFKEYM